MDAIHLNGVNSIKGEIHSLLTLMRLNTKWSQTNQNNNSYNSSNGYIENKFVQAFRRLNEYFEGKYDLREIDCSQYLSPFYQIIVSDTASGPLTCAALNSLVKIVLYGFLSPNYPNARIGMHLIAKSISQCIFEESDWENDEIILMKLLELSHLVYICDASSLLSVKDAWDVYSTCLLIQSQTRASKILRSEAETALRHLTLTAFSRSSNNGSMLDENENLIEHYNDVGFAKVMKDKSWETASEVYTFHGPVGHTLLLGKVMTVLSELMDLQSQPIDRVKFALTLVNVALEAGGPSLGGIGPLVEILSGDICRHLLRTTQSDDLLVFSLALRVVFNLFMSIKDHMKVQLEVYIISVHLRILSQNPANSGVLTAKQELTLESLLEFCREPSLMLDLYINYDCDVQCTNLFDSIVAVLCYQSLSNIIKAHKEIGESFSPSDLSSVDVEIRQIEHLSLFDTQLESQTTVLNILALDGLLSILHSIRNKMYDELLNLAVDDNGLGEIDVDTLSGKMVGVASSDSLKSSASSTPSTPVGKSGGRSASNLDDINYPMDLSPTKDSGSPISFANQLNPSSGMFDNEIVSNFVEDEDADFIIQSKAKTAEILRQRKMKKQKLSNTVDRFNANPLKTVWMKYALEVGLIQKLPVLNNLVVKETDSECSDEFDTQSINTTDSTKISNGNNAIGNNNSNNSNNSNTISNNTNNNEADITTQLDPVSVAHFLRHSPGLDKKQIGEFIGKGPADRYPFHAQVLKAYVNTFEFSGSHSTFVQALRLFLGNFRLPGEAQCIDRIMETFAYKYFESVGVGRPFKSADAVFILSFSTIMLNTDLHNSQIPANKKMTKDEFIRNNRGINEGEDIPREYLESLFDEIKSRQIQLDTEIHAPNSQHSIDVTDTAVWNKLIRKNNNHHAPAAFTPMITARENLKSGSQWISRDICASSIIHEKDMFVAVAKQIFQTILVLWELSAEGNVMKRVFQGLYDFLFLCQKMELFSMLNSALYVILKRLRNWIASGCRKTRNQSKTSKNQQTANNQNNREQGNSNGINLEKLEQFLSMSVFDISRTYCKDQKNMDHSKIKQFWTMIGPYHMELLLKLALTFVLENFHCMEKSVLEALIDLLCISSRKRALQPSLMILVDGICNNHGIHDVKFPMSSYAQSFVDLINNRTSKVRNKSKIDDNNKKMDAITAKSANNGSGGLWNTLGSLFWSGDDKGHPSSKASGMDGNHHHEDGAHRMRQTIDHISTIDSLLSSLPQQDIESANVMNIEISPSPILSSVHLNALSTVWKTSSIESVVIGDFNKMDGNAMFRWLEIIIENLLQRYSIYLSSAEQTNTSTSNDKENAAKYYYIDIIYMLEWISFVILNNTSRIPLFWHKIHGLFRSILEDQIIKGCELCPFFIERTIFHLLNLSANIFSQYSGSQGTTHFSPVTSSAIPRDRDISQSLWSTIRLIRCVPVKYLEEIGDRIGDHVSYLIEVCPGVRSINSLERWYMSFNLLASASAHSYGRVFAWEVVNYLIDSHYINDVNFTPCRHLVLRFLYGLFEHHSSDSQDMPLSKVLDDLEFNYPSTHFSLNFSRSKNIWVLTAIMNLIRLTCSALAGNMKKCEYQSTGIGSPMGKTGANVVSFPLLPWGSLDLSYDEIKTNLPGLSTFHIPVTQKSANHATMSACYCSSEELRVWSQGIPRQYSASEILVTPIEFSNDADVEALWLASCKDLCDVSNSNSTSVARRAILGLQVLINAGHMCNMSERVWFEMIHELLDRLPFQVNESEDEGMEDSGDRRSCYDIGFRCCSLMFDIFVQRGQLVRDTTEFQVFWLRFISILASNVNISVKGSPPCRESIELIVALLRILQPTSSAESLSPAKKEMAGNNRDDSKAKQSNATGKSGNNANSNNQSSGFKWSGLIFGLFDRSNESTGQPETQQEEEHSVHISEEVEPTTGAVCSFESYMDQKLLQLTWKTLESGCSALPTLIKFRNPMLFNYIKKTLENFNNAQNFTPNTNPTLQGNALGDVTDKPQEELSKLPESSNDTSVIVHPSAVSESTVDIIAEVNAEVNSYNSEPVSYESGDSSTFIEDGGNARTNEIRDTTVPSSVSTPLKSTTRSSAQTIVDSPCTPSQDRLWMTYNSQSPLPISPVKQSVPPSELSSIQTIKYQLKDEVKAASDKPEQQRMKVAPRTMPASGVASGQKPKNSNIQVV